MSSEWRLAGLAAAPQRATRHHQARGHDSASDAIGAHQNHGQADGGLGGWLPLTGAVRRLTCDGQQSVAYVTYLETQIAQYTSRAMGAAAELFRAHGAAGREPERHSEDRLGVVALSVHDEQVCAGSAESVECQELVLAQPVIFCRCLTHMALLDKRPKAPLDDRMTRPGRPSRAAPSRFASG